ncbi:hypothetical protein FA95DRAFT_1577551 [Auriscalpium vulgare]|uniref:Uncharacterized protein n=1 Tax=Auriscalpium vulgare TaxID=40419 RepID=A0ACB8R600_9AGAM|nr:hypothetical protein FA95DRAFT_1577551 [Auriscalpium vulgare]
MPDAIMHDRRREVSRDRRSRDRTTRSVSPLRRDYDDHDEPRRIPVTPEQALWKFREFMGVIIHEDERDLFCIDCDAYTRHLANAAFQGDKSLKEALKEQGEHFAREYEKSALPVTAHGALLGKLAALEEKIKSHNIEYGEACDALTEMRAHADAFESKNKELRADVARLTALLNDVDNHRDIRRKTSSSSEITTPSRWSDEPEHDDAMRGLLASQWAPANGAVTTASDPVFEDVPPRVRLGPQAVINASFGLPPPMGHTPVRGRGNTGLRTAQEDPATIDKVNELFAAAANHSNHGAFARARGFIERIMESNASQRTAIHKHALELWAQNRTRRTTPAPATHGTKTDTTGGSADGAAKQRHGWSGSPPQDVIDCLVRLETLVFALYPPEDVVLPRTLRHVGYHATTRNDFWRDPIPYLLRALRGLPVLSLFTVTRELIWKDLERLERACEDMHVDFELYRDPRMHQEDPTTIEKVEELFAAAATHSNHGAFARARGFIERIMESDASQRTIAHNRALELWAQNRAKRPSAHTRSTTTGPSDGNIGGAGMQRRQPQLEEPIADWMEWLAEHAADGQNPMRGVSRGENGFYEERDVRGFIASAQLGPAKTDPTAERSRTKYKHLSVQLLAVQGRYEQHLIDAGVVIAPTRSYVRYTKGVDNLTMRDVAIHFAENGVTIAEADDCGQWARKFIASWVAERKPKAPHGMIDTLEIMNGPTLMITEATATATTNAQGTPPSTASMTTNSGAQTTHSAGDAANASGATTTTNALPYQAPADVSQSETTAIAVSPPLNNGGIATSASASSTILATPLPNSGGDAGASTQDA